MRSQLVKIWPTASFRPLTCTPALTGSAAFLYDPRRHAALLLDVGGLNWIEQPGAKLVALIDQIALIDYESISAIGKPHPANGLVE